MNGGTGVYAASAIRGRVGGTRKATHVKIIDIELPAELNSIRQLAEDRTAAGRILLSNQNRHMQGNLFSGQWIVAGRHWNRILVIKEELLWLVRILAV